MAQKVTIMVIKVDLQCPRCYKKIKKVLCKFQQIRDREFNEKQNTVTITVVCCSPEKIKEKIRYKGGETIKDIEIKVPKNPKPPETKTVPGKVEVSKPQETKPVTKPVNVPVLVPVNVPVPVPEYPAAYPIGVCCRPCCEGRTWGPCYHGYCGTPPPPYYGYVCHDYVSEENPWACTIM